MALRERSRPEARARTASPRAVRRAWRPLALAGIGLLLAVVAAVGPAHKEQTRWAWPPRVLPAHQPQGLWYTPLLLSRQEPASLTATIPCTPTRALPQAARPVLVLATARGRAAGLGVYRTGRSLSVRVAGSTLASAPLAPRAPPRCAYRLELANRSWSLTGGPAYVNRNGDLPEMPTVTGLFSALDLRAAAKPTVEVTSVVLRVQPRLLQGVLWALAALAALTALALTTRPRAVHRRRARALIRHVGRPDLALVALLVGWWIVGPAFFDDGWVAARQQNYSASGGFSAYYTSFGVNLPLDYWLEWLEHWLAQSTHALLLQRLPALVALLATWVVCRWIAARILRPSSAAVRWSFACGFAVVALAWGMTFRPEPVVALLVAGVAAAVIVFVERQSALALTCALLLAVLALTAHPAGIVALAPLLAVAPALLRWAKTNRTTTWTIAVSALTVLAVLATVGSDLHQRRADATSLRTFGDETAGWRDELTRYTLLGQSPYGTPLRRASVALILLAVAAYLLRRREREEPPLGFPARALGLSLLLLFVTPTKWPWHFGALIGLAALAVAAETSRLLADPAAGRDWSLRPFAAIGAAVVAAAWSWNPRNQWGELDLRTLHWTLGIESRITLSKLAAALPVLVLFLALFRRRRRGEPRRRLALASWRAAAWMVPVVAVPLIAFTMAVLVADAARTDSWTLARQNIDTIRGQLGCGLADDVVLASRSSMRALPRVSGTVGGSAPDWLPPPPAPGLTRFTLAPAASSPWFRLPVGRRFGFFLAAAPGAGESLELEWARGPVGRATASSAVATDAGTDAEPELAYWRFYAAADLPAAPAGASAVRFTLQTDGRPGTPVGLTTPVTYDNVPLTTLLAHSRPALALPNVLPYFPCIRQPRVADAAEVPRVLVAFRDSIWPVGTGTSPFDGLTNVYPLVRLPLSDSADPPGNVAVYEVGAIEGGAVARPAVTVTG